MHKPVESILSPFGTCRAHSLARSFFAQKAFYWLIITIVADSVEVGLRVVKARRTLAIYEILTDMVADAGMASKSQ